jgi:RNA polymerase sigma-70 factor (ECF subfamily)
MTNAVLQELLDCCLRKERKCQENLYRTFYSYGTNLAFHYVNDIEQAKAIYNEAMFKVFFKLDTFKAQSEFQTWLHRIVVNAAIDYNRRYFKWDFINEEELINVESMSKGIENELFSDDILNLIQMIAPSYRTVFLLHVMDGFTFKEIAAQLSITEGGAKTLFFKAKQKLQVLLKEYF